MIKKIAIAIGYAILLNIIITKTIDSYYNESLTDMQLFKRLHKSFFWNFNS